MVAAAGTRLALPVFGRLATAILDRIVAGDTLRAGMISAKMSAIWPSMAQDYARELSELAPDAIPSGTTFPSTIPAAWINDTQILGMHAIVWQAQPSSALRSRALDYENTPTTGAAQAVLAQIPRDSPMYSMVTAVAGASPGSLPGILDSLVASSIQETTTPSPSATQIAQTPGAHPPTPAPSRAFTIAETTIVGTVPTPTSSNWPWYALGGALAIGLAVFAVQRIRGGT